MTSQLCKTYSWIYFPTLMVGIFSETTLNSQSNSNGNISKIYIIFELLGIFLSLIINYFNKGIIKFTINSSIIIILFVLDTVFHLDIISVKVLFLLAMLMNVNLINPNKFIRLDVLIGIETFILIIFLHFANIIQNPNNPGLKNGMTLGFIHPNMLGTFVASLLLSIYCYLCKDKGINYYFKMALILIMSYFIYQLTECRTLLYTVVVLFICVLLDHCRNFKLFICKLSSLFAAFLCVFSFVISYIYNPSSSSWRNINSLFSRRISSQSEILSMYPLKWIGTHNQILSPMGKPIGIDNIYMGYTYGYGIIGLIILMCILLKLSTITCKYNKYIPCVILIIYSIIGLTSANVIDIYFSGLLIYALSKCIYHKSKGVKYEDKNS